MRGSTVAKEGIKLAGTLQVAIKQDTMTPSELKCDIQGAIKFEMQQSINAKFLWHRRLGRASV